MYEKIEQCPCCNSLEFTNYIICDDHSISKESFAIMKCINCEFLVTSPRPDQSAIGKYYQSDNYVSHSNKSNNLTNLIFKLARKLTLRQKYNLINKEHTKKKILDYGSGAGIFLKYFKDKGWDTYGVETDQNTRESSIKEYQLDVSPDITSLPTSKFTIITLWHVLEHVHNLNETITQLHKLLVKNGTIYIALPNHDSYDRQYYKQYWAAYDVPRHLYHFNQKTIKALMKYHSFEFIESHPQKLDSFYVSLLSETYKHNKLKYFVAPLLGWISNRWARKHNNNYSSIIYTFKKT